MDSQRLQDFIFVGDVHGRLNDIDYASILACRNKKTQIIQAGDNWSYDEAILRHKLDSIFSRNEKVNNLEKNSLHMDFVDGNHDNFDYLDAHALHPQEINDYVTYMPRGYVEDYGGLIIGFYGGAQSIDYASRIEGKDWWADEVPNYADFSRAWNTFKKYDNIDILITHDCPEEITPHFFQESESSIGKKTRKEISQLVEEFSPRYLFHGHHHISHVDDSTFPNTTVVSLNKNGHEGFAAWFDGEDIVLSKSKYSR